MSSRHDTHELNDSTALQRTPEQVARGKRLEELRSKLANRLQDHDAEDALQEACLRLLVSDNSLAPEKAEATVWLTARRARIESLRASAREAARRETLFRAGLVRLVDDPRERNYIEALLETLGELLKRIPYADRTILTWRYFEGQSLGMIAKRLGIGPKAAASKLERARNRARKFFLAMTKDF